MSFDALAPHYRWMEFVLAARKLHDCRVAFLPRVAAAKKVLLLGEGNGRFLVECAKALPDAHLTCLDSSAGMLHQARRRLENHGLAPDRVEFIHADALGWLPPPASFDLIVTHFFLDCFRPEQLETLIARLAAAAAPGASWLVSDFQVPAAGAQRFRALIIMRMMYAFFRAVTRLPARGWTSPDGWLEKNGFRLAERRVSEWGLLHSDLWREGLKRSGS